MYIYFFDLSFEGLKTIDEFPPLPLLPSFFPSNRQIIRRISRVAIIFFFFFSFHQRRKDIVDHAQMKFPSFLPSFSRNYSLIIYSFNFVRIWILLEFFSTFSHAKLLNNCGKQQSSTSGTRGEGPDFLSDVKRPELNISLDDGGKPVKCRGSP